MTAGAATAGAATVTVAATVATFNAKLISIRAAPAAEKTK
jgi:hypothetical protein